MPMLERFAITDPARSVLEIGAVAATLLVVAAIGCVVRWLEDRFESDRRSLARIDAGGPLHQHGPRTHRTVRPALPAQIVSPRRTYLISGLLGTGDLCDVHRAVADDAEWVLKRARDSGADEWLLREECVLRQLAEAAGDGPYRSYLPPVDESFRGEDRRVLVFRRHEGLYSAEEIHRQFPDGLDGRHLAWMFNRTLEALRFSHNQGWIHGAVLPPHLLFHVESHGLQLVDWTHAAPIGRRLRTADRQYRDWYPRILQQSLPTLFGLCLRKGYLDDPAILVGGVGDATCDIAPLQVGQFESGNEIEDDLERIFLEGGGGGQQTESYELALYFLARKTSLDCHEKRGQRGYAFLIGDEMPYRKVKRREVRRVFGDLLPEDIPLREIVEEARRKWELYFILPNLTSYYNDPKILRCWRALLGQHVLRLENPAAISELIATTIGLSEGAAAWEGVAGDLQKFGGDAAVVRAVTHALEDLPLGSAAADAGLSET